MMKMTTLTCVLVVTGAVALGAQSSETTTKTKVEIKDGKDVKVTGCDEAGAGAEFLLTNVADKTGALHQYVLVPDGEDLSKHVGQRVLIEGKVADRGNGKVEIKSETKVEGPGNDTQSKIQGAGAYLGVKHLKMIAASCP